MCAEFSAPGPRGLVGSAGVDNPRNLGLARIGCQHFANSQAVSSRHRHVENRGVGADSFYTQEGVECVRRSPHPETQELQDGYCLSVGL